MSESELIPRVEALERQNRSLRRGMAALTVAAASLVWMAQTSPIPGELRARRLVLVTETGEVRGELTTTSAGLPVLSLRDQAGNVLIRMTGDGTRAVLSYRDDKGEMHDVAAPMGMRPLTQRPN